MASIKLRTRGYGGFTCLGAQRVSLCSFFFFFFVCLDWRKEGYEGLLAMDGKVYIKGWIKGSCMYC